MPWHERCLHILPRPWPPPPQCLSWEVVTTFLKCARGQRAPSISSAQYGIQSKAPKLPSLHLQPRKMVYLLVSNRKAVAGGGSGCAHRERLACDTVRWMALYRAAISWWRSVASVSTSRVRIVSLLFGFLSLPDRLVPHLNLSHPSCAKSQCSLAHRLTLLNSKRHTNCKLVLIEFKLARALLDRASEHFGSGRGGSCCRARALGQTISH